MTTYQGSCQCGAIAFELRTEGEIDSLMECNCSRCGRLGTLLTFVSPAQFELKTPRDAYRTYQFNAHVIEHHFCPTCGVQPFSEGTDPKGNRMVAVNARCLEGFDHRGVPKSFFDGASR